MDRRERLIFAWIDGWRSSGGNAQPPLPPLGETCELYAASGGHWLTGDRLAQSCLACHAPPDRFASGDFAQCATCHGDAHAEWSASSHGRSTLHLNLARVNEQTKQVERYDVGPREGLVCTSCHAPAAADAPNVAPLPPGTVNLVVPHRFRRGVASASCATCHAETQAEWEAWKGSPRPKPSRWLPGDVTWDEDPATAQSCVACHMPQRAAGAGGGLVHALAARRDAALMRGGLAARLEPATAARGPLLVLTNLAGHRYPSGTVRRALRIELRYDTDPGDGPMRLLTRLTDSTVPPTQSALAPAEQRPIELPRVAGASRVTCQITYERNQFEPGAYELPLHTLTERATGPMGRE